MFLYRARKHKPIATNDYKKLRGGNAQIATADRKRILHQLRSNRLAVNVSVTKVDEGVTFTSKVNTLFVDYSSWNDVYDFVND